MLICRVGNGEELPMDFFEYWSGLTFKFMLLFVAIVTIAIRVQQISSRGATFAFQGPCMVSAFNTVTPQ